jgi:hypothetical protein
MQTQKELSKENELKVHKVNKIDAEKIVSNLLDWNKPSVILDHIREFFECFFLIEEDPGPELKSTVYSTYKALEYALKDLQNPDHDAEIIISDIVRWKEMPMMIDDLNEMFDCFILYTDSMNSSDKEYFYRSYKNVKFVLEQINSALNGEVLEDCLTT